MAGIILGQGKFGIIAVATHQIFLVPNSRDVVLNGPIEVRAKVIDLGSLLLPVLGGDLLRIYPGEEMRNRKTPYFPFFVE